MRVDNAGIQKQLGRAEALSKPSAAPNSNQATQTGATRNLQFGDNVGKLATSPFDAERVGAIQKAIDKGSYPLVPAKIADAIIAARYLLRKPE